MTAVLLKQVEAEPDAYPVVAGLSAGAAGLVPGAIWQRIENWIAYRWPVRRVVWTAHGGSLGGLFCPPLSDWAITTVEQAQSVWVPVPEIDVSVIGVYLPPGIYRVTANVGSDDDPPAAVIEAYRRLAEYLAEAGEQFPVGATRVSEDIGPINTTMTRSVTHMAQALRLSGAADLLRPWRNP